MENKDDWLN
jgi:hypothetical protein